MFHQGISIQFSSLQGRLSWVRLKKQAEELGGEELAEKMSLLAGIHSGAISGGVVIALRAWPRRHAVELGEAQQHQG
jgi:hypothetical protein